MAGQRVPGEVTRRNQSFAGLSQPRHKDGCPSPTSFKQRAMERKVKKNQHYVFRAYLKPWAQRDLIYCLREGRVFQPNLEGVACERFFYRLQDLTPGELRLIEEFLSKHPSELLKTMQKQFLETYLLPTRLKKRLGKSADREFLAVLDRVIAEGQEDYHQIIEEHLLVFLQQMLGGSVDFYSDSEQAALFLHAICVQYTRTKRTIEASIEVIGPQFNGCDVRRVMGALSPLMAMAVGQGLFIDREKFKLVLIDNNSETPFITADQPVVNLQAGYTRKPPEKFELFYPLSPKKAMLLLETSSKREEFPVSGVSVNSYNMMMAKNSYEQIFSDSEEYLNTVNRAIRCS